MSNCTGDLASQQRHEFLTAHAAGHLAGVARHTVRAHVPPDGWLRSHTGARLYPLWLTETIEAWAAARLQAKGGAK